MRGPCADDQGNPLFTHPPPAPVPADEDEDGEGGDGGGEGGGGGGGGVGAEEGRGGGGVVDSRATEGGWWWLVVTKCCGDVHVPMGTCSIRVSVGAVCGREHILQDSPGHGGGTSGARGGERVRGRGGLEEGELEGGGRGGGGGGYLMLLGGGMLAMQGFRNASFSPGTLRCNRNGTVSFAWHQWEDMSMDFEPFLAADHEVVAAPSLRQPVIRLNDPQVLRQRSPSPPPLLSPSARQACSASSAVCVLPVWGHHREYLFVSS